MLFNHLGKLLQQDEVMYQICHDDCIHENRLRGGSQSELEATWRLA